MTEHDISDLINKVKTIQKKRIDCDVSMRQLAAIVSNGYIEDEEDLGILIASQRILKRATMICQEEFENLMEGFNDEIPAEQNERTVSA